MSYKALLMRTLINQGDKRTLDVLSMYFSDPEHVYLK